MADDLFGKYILGKGAAKPAQKDATKPKYRDGSDSPLVKEIKKSQATTKAKAEASYSARVRKDVQSEAPVAIRTKYGTADVQVKGWKAMSADEKRAYLEKTKREIEADQDSVRGVAKKPINDPYADPGSVTEADTYRGIANTYLGNQPGFKALDAVSKSDTGKALSGGLREFSKRANIQVDAPVKGSGGADIQGLIDMTLNTPSQVAGNLADIFDSKVDPIGKLQSTAEAGMAIIPAATAGRTGLRAFSAARKAGSGALQAVGKGVSAAAMDSIGAQQAPPKFDTDPSPSLKNFAEESGDEFYENFYGTATNNARTKPVVNTPNPEPPAAPVLNDIVPQTGTGVLNSGTENVTSARKAMVAEDRAAMGNPEIEAPIRKSFGQSYDNAKAKGYDNDNWASTTSDEVLKKPRSLDDEETAGITLSNAKIKAQHKSLLEQAENVTDPSELQKINEQLRNLEEVHAKQTLALTRSGTEKGRTLNAQKFTIDDSYDLVTVKTRAKINKGSELTAKENAKLTLRVQELESEMASQSKRMAEMADELAKATAVDRARRKAGGFTRAQATASRIEAKRRFDAALAKSASRVSFLALNDATPEVVKAFRDYVNATIDEGARGIDDVIKRMADDGTNVDAEDIYRALTEKTGLRKLSDIQAEINAARKSLREESRDIARPNWREEAKAKAKATREKPENVAKRVAKTKEQLQKQINELDNLIKEGNYIEAQPKKARDMDAEVYKMRMIRKAKEARVKEIQESVRPLSAAETAGSVLTEMKMLNPYSRLTDVLANTSNLASTAVETIPRYAVDRIASAVSKKDPLISYAGSRERLARTMDRINSSMKPEFVKTWTGTDSNTLEKFGKSRGLGGKLAGSTDVPFRVVYREFGHDLFAELKAKKILGSDASRGDIDNMRTAILNDLDNHLDVMDAADEYALYKTFNNSNAVSESFAMIRRQVLKGDWQRLAFDELIARFSKVLTNVAVDAYDRTPLGVASNALKYAAKKDTLTDVQRLIVTDKLAKGLVGSALSTLGYFVGDKLQIEFKGDQYKYADLGDIENIGGGAGAFLQGVLFRNAEKIGGDKEDAFKQKMVVDLFTNSPAASNIKDLAEGLMSPGQGKIQKLIAKKLTNAEIPSFVRGTATRMDSPNFGLTGSPARRETVPQEYNSDTDRMRQTRNLWLILINEEKSKLPGVRQTLPLKD